MKNSNGTIGKGTQDFPPCSAVTVLTPAVDTVSIKTYILFSPSIFAILIFFVFSFYSSSSCLFLRATLRFSYSFLHTTFAVTTQFESGPGSSVSIVTGYGLDRPGIETRWGRDFPQLSRPALGPTQPPVQRVPGPYRG
jgi:hypothetical protein